MSEWFPQDRGLPADLVEEGDAAALELSLHRWSRQTHIDTVAANNQGFGVQLAGHATELIGATIDRTVAGTIEDSQIDGRMAAADAHPQRDGRLSQDGSAAPGGTLYPMKIASEPSVWQRIRPSVYSSIKSGCPFISNGKQHCRAVGGSWPTREELTGLVCMLNNVALIEGFEYPLSSPRVTDSRKPHRRQWWTGCARHRFSRRLDEHRDYECSGTWFLGRRLRRALVENIIEDTEAAEVQGVNVGFGLLVGPSPRRPRSSVRAVLSPCSTIRFDVLRATLQS